MMAAWTVVELFFGGRKGAVVAIALALAAVAAGAWLVANAFTIAGLEADVAKAEKETAKAREDLAVVTADRDGLKMTLDQQSAAITRLQESNTALSREANLRAALMLSQGRAESDKIRKGPAMNPEELNAWFRVHFQ